MSEVTIRGQVGPATLQDGAEHEVRIGRTAELVVQELHGRFYEQNYRGNLYSGGMGITSISASTFTTANLTATETPIIGVYNPSTSTVNVVVLQAVLSVIQNALQATGCGGFVWASSVGNTAISTGTTPLNRRTLVTGGAQARDTKSPRWSAKSTPTLSSTSPLPPPARTRLTRLRPKRRCCPSRSTAA